MAHAQINVDTFNRMLRIHREYNMPDVLVHGDLWANNVLFTKSIIPLWFGAAILSEYLKNLE
jgi:fructosamine-3-kinase